MVRLVPTNLIIQRQLICNKRLTRAWSPRNRLSKWSSYSMKAPTPTWATYSWHSLTLMKLVYFYFKTQPHTTTMTKSRSFWSPTWITRQWTCNFSWPKHATKQKLSMRSKPSEMLDLNFVSSKKTWILNCQVARDFKKHVVSPKVWSRTTSTWLKMSHTWVSTELS